MSAQALCQRCSQVRSRLCNLGQTIRLRRTTTSSRVGFLPNGGVLQISESSMSWNAASAVSRSASGLSASTETHIYLTIARRGAPTRYRSFEGEWLRRELVKRWYEELVSKQLRRWTPHFSPRTEAPRLGMALTKGSSEWSSS